MSSTPTLADHPGASAAWTSNDPVVEEARRLVSRGDFAEAEKLLVGESQARRELRELIRRIRWEHDLDDAGLLAKLKTSIPNVTASDLKRWRDEGVLQHRMIDGQVRYFRREPSNLFRFSDEAKRRRVPVKTEESWSLEKHLAVVIATAEKSGEALVNPVRHVCDYTVTIPARHPLAKPGASVRCWLPFPQEHERQRDVKLVSTSPARHELNAAGTPQRAVYLEQTVTDARKPIVFSARFEYTSFAYYPTLDDAKARMLSPGYSGGHLNERPPHISFTPELRKAVADVVGADTNPLVRARKIFEWIDTNIRYCSEEEYGNIPSFSEKAFRTRKGDCGIQGMMFITMCRIAGIPARWQSGWQTKPGGLNLHDWAEFYVEPWGWLPADPSYGLRDSADPKVRYFYLGHQDSYRMIVNLDYGAPLVPRKESLRSEPADFQRGEIEIDGVNLYFNEWDYEMKIDRGK